jgi:hypothetical protein
MKRFELRAVVGGWLFLVYNNAGRVAVVGFALTHARALAAALRA